MHSVVVHISMIKNENHKSRFVGFIIVPIAIIVLQNVTAFESNKSSYYLLLSYLNTKFKYRKMLCLQTRSNWINIIAVCVTSIKV